MKGIVIVASSRSTGNTSKVIDYFCSLSTFDKIDLNDYDIGYFSYDFKNAEDDFLELITYILNNYDCIVLATPIYWYTMSAQLKTFLDRISDLLIVDENNYLGRKFSGKFLASISCGSTKEIFDGYAMPFRETANYLDMYWFGNVHTWIEKDAVALEAIERLNELKKKIYGKYLD